VFQGPGQAHRALDLETRFLYSASPPSGQHVQTLIDSIKALSSSLVIRPMNWVYSGASRLYVLVITRGFQGWCVVSGGPAL
jgi:hypothetical protein